MIGDGRSDYPSGILSSIAHRCQMSRPCLDANLTEQETLSLYSNLLLLTSPIKRSNDVWSLVVWACRKAPD